MSIQILIAYFFQFLHIFVRQPVSGLLELLMAFPAQVDYCLSIFFVMKYTIAHQQPDKVHRYPWYFSPKV